MKCGAKTKAGKRCQAPALGGSKPPRCMAHAEGRAGQRQAEARREGGRQRARQVYRKPPPPEAPPRIETRSDALEAMREVHARIASGELSARDGSVMLTAIRDMLPLLPEGDSPDLQFFGLFVRVHAYPVGFEGHEEERHIGETKEGLRVPFTAAQSASYTRALKAEGLATIRVKRAGQVELPDVTFEIDGAREEHEDEGSPGGLPVTVVYRGQRGECM